MGRSNLTAMSPESVPAYDAGLRTGEIRGALSACRRFVADRGLLAELTARAELADLVRRFGLDYVTPHLRDQGMLGLLEQPTAAPPVVPVPSDANSPEGVGAKGEPGGWTGGLVDPGEEIDGP